MKKLPKINAAKAVKTSLPYCQKAKAGSGVRGARSAFILPLTPFPAFAMPLAWKRPKGRASHHARVVFGPHILCRAGGLGNAPTSRKGYSFPLLAKKVADTQFSLDCSQIQHFHHITKSRNTGE